MAANKWGDWEIDGHVGFGGKADVLRFDIAQAFLKPTSSIFAVTERTLMRQRPETTPTMKAMGRKEVSVRNIWSSLNATTVEIANASKSNTVGRNGSRNSMLRTQKEGVSTY